jgi:Tol biopolymer transport system component
MVYLYNRETLETTPLNDVGSGPLAISADGRFVAFGRHEGSASEAVSAFTLYDRVSRTFTRMTPPSLAYRGEIASAMISADGRYTVFASLDPELVPGQADTFTSWDVFQFDRSSGTVTLVSHASSSASAAGDSFSYSPAISANGARIVFDSTASNLIEGLKDLNEGHDVFVHEVASGSNALISYRAPSLPSLSSSTESQASALSADGRFVAFESKSPSLISGQVDSNGMTDVFLYDRSTQAVTLVSRTRTSSSKTANGQSVQPALSADGRYVAFVSNATDIVPENNPTETDYKIFLFDRITGTSVLVGRTGQPAGPEYYGWNVKQQISQDGRWVVFTSLATDLIAGQQEQNPAGDPPTLDLFLWDRVSGKTILVSRSNAGATVTARGDSYLGGFSAEGRSVVFSSSANDLIPGHIEPTDSFDVFHFDRVTGRVTLVSHARDSVYGTISGAGADISADGRFVVFTSDAEGLDPEAPPGAEESIYVYDRVSATAQWVAKVDVSVRPRMSADGRYIVFNSLRDLVPGINTAGQHIYLYDRISKTIALVTHPAIPNGHGSAGNHGTATISSDGRYIAFTSSASDLVEGLISAPGRDDDDIFLFDRISNTTVLVNRLNGSPVTAPGMMAGLPLLSASGRQVAFTSAVDLGEGDFNNRSDAYVFSLDPPPPSTGPIPVPTCKLLDTRRRADRPVLTSNVQRTVAVRGACGVPATAKQVQVNVTVFNPSGKGNLRFYLGAVTATPSGILRFERNATRIETFTLPLSANGTLTILPFVAGRGTVHVAVEVTGYSN